MSDLLTLGVDPSDLRLAVGRPSALLAPDPCSLLHPSFLFSSASVTSATMAHILTAVTGTFLSYAPLLIATAFRYMQN